MAADRIRRYTTLPFLIDLLRERRLTFLDPATWEDKNDSYFLNEYRVGARLQSVLALCFAGPHESYGIWKVFADGPSGVCVEFIKSRVVAYLKGEPRVKYRPVVYVPWKDVQAKGAQDFELLPFMKRWAFKTDEEFRAIWLNPDRITATEYLRIGPDCIRRIIFNPWLSDAVFQSVRKTIAAIDGCERLPITRTSFTDDETWKATGHRIALAHSGGQRGSP